MQALVKEDATQCIRKGVVNNIDKTATCLKNIVAKLSKTMKQNISHVYVGVGGQSVRSVRNVIVKDLPTETIVDGDIVDGLMDSNRGMDYPDLEILNVVTQEYKVGNQYVVDPVGIKGTRLEGNFLNIAQRKLFYSNLNEAFDKAGIAIAEIFPAPLVLADNVLTESEKRGGCVLVDLGADTTTVSVYHKSLLRHLAVIPLGGNNVTKDITALKMEEREAELLKLKHGSAYTEIADMDPALTYSIDGERTMRANSSSNWWRHAWRRLCRTCGIRSRGVCQQTSGWHHPHGWRFQHEEHRAGFQEIHAHGQDTQGALRQPGHQVQHR